jgi:hypothetical protein
MFKTIGIVLGIIALVAGLSILMAYPTMWIVNYLFAPSFLVMVFGTAKIPFLKALWLNVIMGLLVKSSSSSSK